MRQKAGPVRGALAGIALLALVAGCAPTSFGTGPTLPGPDVPWNPEDLGITCDDGPYPQWDAPPAATVVVVRATRCINRTEHIPGDGEWAVRHEQEATARLEALAAALRLPDVPVTDQPEHALVEPPLCDRPSAPIVITLTDSTGRRFVPRIPHKCGHPLPAVLDAITALAWTDTATRPLARLRSELAVTSGCEDGWKPTIGLIATGGPGEPAPDLGTTPRPVRVCRYEIQFGHPIKFSDDWVLHAGGLVSASTLDADAAGELLTAVAAAPRAEPCEPDEATFAVVHLTDVPAPWVAVELEGCYRAAIGFEDHLRQLDPDLVTRLLTWAGFGTVATQPDRRPRPLPGQNPRESVVAQDAGVQDVGIGEDHPDKVGLAGRLGHSVRPRSFCRAANSASASRRRGRSASRNTLIDDTRMR